MNSDNRITAQDIPIKQRISPKQPPETLQRSNTTTEEEKALKIENTGLYFVVWEAGKPKACATDPTTAEEIARSFTGIRTFITKEDRPPEGLPIDRRTGEDATGFYMSFVQDEQKRSACRCCANCGNYCTEYGETFCRLDAIPETADPCKFSCPEWV